MGARNQKEVSPVRDHWRTVKEQWGAGSEMSAGTACDDTSLQALFGDAVALVHRLKAAAEELHHQGEMSAGRRGILMGLHRSGPQTVPQMARVRPVSRQHIQALVNPLAEEGYVELVDNPAHKRSRLVRLTPKGVDFVAAMRRRESCLLPQLAIDATEEEILNAARVLRAVRTAFESAQWRRLVEEEERP